MKLYLQIKKFKLEGQLLCSLNIYPSHLVGLHTLPTIETQKFVDGPAIRKMLQEEGWLYSSPISATLTLCDEPQGYGLLDILGINLKDESWFVLGCVLDKDNNNVADVTIGLFEGVIDTTKKYFIHSNVLLDHSNKLGCSISTVGAWLSPWSAITSGLWAVLTAVYELVSRCDHSFVSDSDAIDFIYRGIAAVRE